MDGGAGWSHHDHRTNPSLHQNKHSNTAAAAAATLKAAEKSAETQNAFNKTVSHKPSDSRVSKELKHPYCPLVAENNTTLQSKLWYNAKTNLEDGYLLRDKWKNIPPSLPDSQCWSVEYSEHIIYLINDFICS